MQLLRHLEPELEDRPICDENAYVSATEGDRIDPTLPQQEWEGQLGWQGQDTVDINWQDQCYDKVQGHDDNATNEFTEQEYRGAAVHGGYCPSIASAVDKDTDTDEDLELEEGTLPVQIVEDDYHELLRQNELEDDPSLMSNRYFSQKANDHRPGWIAPTAHEARVLLDSSAPIYRPVMPLKTSKSSRKYRPQITKEIVMRVLGLDSNEYLNLRGSARTIVQTHGLDLPDATGKLTS